MKPSKYHFGLRALFLIGLCLAGLLFSSIHGAEIPAAAQDKSKSTMDSDEDHTIRIAVEEVRLDAVVLDKKGRPIADLTAEDFEVFQDGKPQEVLSSIYITNQSEPSASPALPGIKSQTDASIPMPELERDEVRRVIVFVVDDVSMAFEYLHYARLSLRRFVERQMQPGDLVAIMTTGYGNSAFQMFRSDKQQLLDRIDTLAWGPNAGFTFVNTDFGMDTRERLFDSQLAALRYSIRALKDLPGRKTILLLSAQPTLPRQLAKTREELFDHNFEVDYYHMYIEAFDRLADEALRAGVVVHVMDIRGLEAPFPDPQGLEGPSPTPFPGGGTTYEDLSERATDGLNPLPAKTGGIFVENRNFFVDGIGDVDNLLQGYYLLSYAPPPDTFKSGDKEDWHKTEIKVKRRGATVYTRDGFYGKTGTAEESLIVPDPLQEAMFSPFQYHDLEVNLASGYVDDGDAGYMLRSWLHLDAQNVSFLEKKDEGYFITLETVCVTTDVNGYIQDSGLMHYTHVFQIKEDNLSWVKKQGVRFSLLLPVKKPGAYYVRVAVKDQESGKVGSAYQYVEIPDLKKNRLALSSLFVINSKDDAAWLVSGETREISQNGITPILRQVGSRSAALPVYVPGDHFQYMSVIYNAESKKDTAPDLESRFVLYRDGSELFQSEPQPLTLSDTGNFARIPIRNRLLLGGSLEKGDYVLQLVVNDKKRRNKDGTASQTMSFKIE